MTSRPVIPVEAGQGSQEAEVLQDDTHFVIPVFYDLFCVQNVNEYTSTPHADSDAHVASPEHVYVRCPHYMCCCCNTYLS
jgi:hypothetical protein